MASHPHRIANTDHEHNAEVARLWDEARLEDAARHVERRCVKPIPPELLARIMREDAEYARQAAERDADDAALICGVVGAVVLAIGILAVLLP